MAKQQLHSAFAAIDVLTRIELDESLHKGLNDAVRSRYLGLDSVRLPLITVQGNGGTVNLGAIGTSDGYSGPEQGDVWMLRRVLVASSAFATDTAKYVVFRGSTPSDPSSYSNRNLIDGLVFNPGTTFTTTTAPAVPATGVAVQNPTNQPYTVVISPNGATITNVSVNGITVGTSAGTYVVPAFGSISIAYTVATPTWTWTATQTNVAAGIGQNVGLGYYPGTKSVLLQPGEQIYAQVFGTTAGNTYILSGEGIRVPAEMKGKVLD